MIHKKDMKECKKESVIERENETERNTERTTSIHSHRQTHTHTQILIALFPDRLLAACDHHNNCLTDSQKKKKESEFPSPSLTRRWYRVQSALAGRAHPCGVRVWASGEGWLGMVSYDQPRRRNVNSKVSEVWLFPEWVIYLPLHMVRQWKLLLFFPRLDKKRILPVPISVWY